MLNIIFKDNKFVNTQGEKVIFKFSNSTIFDYTKQSIKIKSKSIDNIYPTLIKIEKDNNLANSLELSENGIIFDMAFSNNIYLKDLIDKRKRYNIECRLYTIHESRLLFKIIKISDAQSFDVDVIPEPDYVDILDIRNSIKTKICNIKNKMDELYEVNLNNMSLSEMINLEDNLYDFIQNNI